MSTAEIKELARVVVTNPMVGLLAMQVCAVKDATDEEILHVANRENLCGTTNGWCHVVRELEEHYEEKHLPVQCKDHEDRLHFLVTC